MSTDLTWASSLPSEGFASSILTFSIPSRD
jgi:hypothetical protein